MIKPVFLKQYGERRTGTNYLRGLLRANFDNVVVLMHVLGDKHSAPVPIDLPENGSAEEAHAWVRTLTHAAPAESTRTGNEAQEQYMREVAVDLVEAARDQRLGFLISVKDPYAWGASVSAYYGWLPRGGPRAKPHFPLPSQVWRVLRPVEQAVKCRQLWAGCLRSNRKHRAWLDLYERLPSQTSIVRYEDLLTEPARILCELQRKYGLRQKGEPVSAIDQVLVPA